MTTEVTLDELEAALAALEAAPKAGEYTNVADTHPPVQMPTEASPEVMQGTTGPVTASVEIPREVVQQAAEAIEKIAEKVVASATVVAGGPVTSSTVVVETPVVPETLVEQEAPQEEEEVETPRKPGSLALTDYVDPAEVKRDVSIDMSDLDNETCRQSATYLHHAQRASMAKAQAKRIKVQSEIAESKMYAIHRDALSTGGGKVTEAMIDAAVKKDARYVAMKQKVIDAELIADLARDAAFAMEQRKDMLVQLTADRRKEREGELRMTAAANAVDQVRQTVLQGVAAAAK